MAATNTNRTVLSGNLTRDPELRTTANGTAVCSLRIASNSRTKVNGEWTDKAGYFDVTVFGAQGENAAKYLAKGRQVIVDGKLSWREWETKDHEKRQSVEIVADNLEWVGNANAEGSQPNPEREHVDPPHSDDDIPF